MHSRVDYTSKVNKVKKKELRSVLKKVPSIPTSASCCDNVASSSHTLSRALKST